MSCPLSEKIDQLRAFFLQELRDLRSSKDLEQLKVKYLGKKGLIQELMQELRHASSQERPHLGQLINSLKEEVSSHLENSLARLKEEEMLLLFEKEWIDPTLPGRKNQIGRAHPITKMLEKITEILVEMGFSVQKGPDVETDYYNFEGLNFASDHPARDMQDTFYLGNGLLLRTHTSNVQVHAMEKFTPPMKIVAPGRAFRNEDISARSHVFFHQIEGFAIDRGVTFSDLLTTMRQFLQKLMGKDRKVRFRPSYFPFVEPGMEVDVECTRCSGAGCRICKHSGWLEILGAGMIHPNVLRNSGIDPEIYSGYAWGMGIERLAMLHYDIPDIRMFTENDLRFLSQIS